MYKLLPKEVIQATTIHAARSTGEKKSIAVWKLETTDLLVLDIPNYRYLLIILASTCGIVIKKGKLFYHRQ